MNKAKFACYFIYFVLQISLLMTRKKQLLLCLLSGLLFVPAWYTWGSGLFLFVAFIPLLFVEADMVKRKVKGSSWFWLPFFTFAHLEFSDHLVGKKRLLPGNVIRRSSEFLFHEHSLLAVHPDPPAAGRSVSDISPCCFTGWPSNSFIFTAKSPGPG